MLALNVVGHFSGASEATTGNSGDKQDTLAPKADRAADLTNWKSWVALFPLYFSSIINILKGIMISMQDSNISLQFILQWSTIREQPNTI